MRNCLAYVGAAVSLLLCRISDALKLMCNKQDSRQSESNRRLWCKGHKETDALYVSEYVCSWKSDLSIRSQHHLAVVTNGEHLSFSNNKGLCPLHVGNLTVASRIIWRHLGLSSLLPLQIPFNSNITEFYVWKKDFLSSWFLDQKCSLACPELKLS